MRRIGAGAISLAVALPTGTATAEPLADLTGGQVGHVEFRSSTPASRWRLAARQTAEQNPLTIWGDLVMPPNAREKVPAVILSHGSDGLANPLYRGVWAKALTEAGYAVFLVDSQTPRGVAANLGDLQLTWNTTGNISDALHALKFLATHPRIDTTRIYNIGFSRGASAAFAAAWPFYQRAVLPEGVQWAGTVAVYPGCNLRYHDDHHGTNPAALLLLLAEKDDMTPAPPCVEYAKELAAAGNDVRYKVYPGAYHVFDRLDQPWRKVREGTFAECSIEIHMSNDPREPFKSRDYKTGEIYSNFQQWSDAIHKCETTKFITVQSSPVARKQAVQDVLDFFGISR
ncbi:MAG: dienelactone hydrolase family protein [Ideonella sp.]|nr:dienelactone hydrolase family protein [Ideonella sp.]